MIPTMSLSTLALGILPLISSVVAAGPLSSPKRGLVFTPNSSHSDDYRIWTSKPSSLTWYYNYEPNPSSVFDSIPQAEFEFVPMLWGAPSDPSDTSFLKTIQRLVKDKGINITNVLSFNEPDGPFSWGGSNMDPDLAARVWVNNLEPLCSKVISAGGPTKNCTYDFVTLHWYGGFEGLASHMGEYSATFPNKTMWVTEYNLNDQDLQSTQAFYNISAEYFDRLEFVERYSLFGAFRSHVSNVGPNASMLSESGELTDMGAWYLGRESTGVLPTTGGGSKSGASTMTITTLFGAVTFLLPLS